MRKERDEVLVVAFSVLKLQVTIITDGCNVVLCGNVRVVASFDISGSIGSFAGETDCGGIMGSCLFVG